MLPLPQLLAPPQAVLASVRRARAPSAEGGREAGAEHAAVNQGTEGVDPDGAGAARLAVVGAGAAACASTTAT